MTAFKVADSAIPPFSIALPLFPPVWASELKTLMTAKEKDPVEVGLVPLMRKANSIGPQINLMMQC